MPMTCVVVIPVYKKTLTNDETFSLVQVCNVLSNYEICLVCPKSLDLTMYHRIATKQLKVEYFSEKYFVGIAGYNELVESFTFYYRFRKYDYMLIYQLDAWVFRDELNYWCSLGYDYIGAPQLKDGLSKIIDWKIGNGGFCLRKIEKFLSITKPNSVYYLKDNKNKKKEKVSTLLKYYSDLNEDLFFNEVLNKTNLSLNVPTIEEAAKFSFEQSPSVLYKMIDKLPFGCHAFRKWEYLDFWNEYIKIPKETSDNKVSIVTITYNNIKGLKKTAKSILSQTLQSYEWIIIDGGSEDGTKEYVNDVLRDFVSVFISEKDDGVYDAQNKGTSQSKGEYIVYMNAGDIFFDETVLSKVFSKRHKADILFGDWYYTKDGERFLVHSEKNVDKYYFNFKGNLCHQSMFIKRKLIINSPYDVNFRIYSDWLKWKELSLGNITYEYLNLPICVFDMEDGLSTKYTTTKVEEMMTIKKKVSADLLKEYRIKTYKYDICMCLTSDVNNGISIWRAIFFKSQLEKKGLRVKILTMKEINDIAYLTDVLKLSEKVIIFRPEYPRDTTLLSVCNNLNKDTAVDLDDILIPDAAVYDGSFLSCTNNYDTIKSQYTRVFTTLSLMPTVFVSTETIKHELDKLLSINCVIKPNLINSILCNKPEKRVNPRFKMILSSGSKTHQDDLYEILDELIIFMNKYRDTELVMVGDTISTDDFLWVKDRVDFKPYLKFEELLSEYRKCDLLLVPLKSNIFNDAKSNIKFIEAGSQGLPVLAKDCKEFSKCIKDGINGFLYHDDFLQKLTDIYKNRNSLYMIGSNAYNDVLDLYSTNKDLDKKIKEWINEYNGI